MKNIIFATKKQIKFYEKMGCSLWCTEAPQILLLILKMTGEVKEQWPPMRSAGLPTGVKAGSLELPFHRASFACRINKYGTSK